MRAAPRCVAGALLVTTLAVPAGAAPKCPNVTTSGRWTTITLPPDLGYNPVEIVPAATRKQRDVLVSFNGRVVQHSTDGGCTWKVAYSLDTDPPPDSQARANAAVQFRDIAVTRNRTGPRTVYAFAANSVSDLTVTMPFSTLVSTDGGLRWRLIEKPLGPSFTSETRCGASSTITTGPDPRIAHLTCYTQAWGELALNFAGVQCNTVMYVTTNAAETWREVTPRSLDPAQAASGTTRANCGQMFGAVGDEWSPHVLWDIPGCSTDLYRSADDGKTRTRYARFDKAPCTVALMTGTYPRGGSLVLACTTSDVSVAKPGKMVKSPGIPMRVHEKGTIRGCAIDSKTGRVLAFYLDGENRSRLFAYDIARRTWTSLGFVPVKKGERAWDQYGSVGGVVSPAWRYAYAHASFGATRIFRLSL